MALERLQGLVHRFHLAAPNHFADWKNPTLLELNANPTNNPNGTIFNLTCALDTANTTLICPTRRWMTHCRSVRSRLIRNR